MLRCGIINLLFSTTIRPIPTNPVKCNAGWWPGGIPDSLYISTLTGHATVPLSLEHVTPRSVGLLCETSPAD